jgi:hypothetical protein
MGKMNGYTNDSIAQNQALETMQWLTPALTLLSYQIVN